VAAACDRAMARNRATAAAMAARGRIGRRAGRIGFTKPAPRVGHTH
jgi:hypothetical protein